MKIVVVGGNGLIGSKLVTMLTRYGHEVVAASRRSGVDAVTGEGLAQALRGASVDSIDRRRRSRACRRSARRFRLR
jgi:uncharacterized protein YbjT (DUF2867 family)